MMESTPADRWKACLDYIREHIPPTEYTRWFEPLALAECRDGRVVVSIPTKYVGEYIRENHRQVVAEALALTFGQQATLMWRDEEAVAQWRKEQEEKKRLDAPIQEGPMRAPKRPRLDPNLNPSLNFDAFIEGESNRLARAVALSIAEKPGQITFNPFFLYGPSGVGKTHLVSAIGLRLAELHPEMRILFVSAHLFKTQYADAVIHNTTNEFLNFYQSVEVLIIDDIQEITTAKTQMVFFHIFNHLQQNRRQLIITCDRPPSLFEGIEERMLTRFKWGMVAELERPDIQLRRDTLTSKIQRDGLSFPPEVITYIATTVESSVRELEGIINGIMAYSVVDNCDIDLALTQRIVARIVNLEKKELTIDDITVAVGKHYGIKVRDICSKGRKAQQVQARQVAMYLCHKYTGLSYAQIGRAFGKRDHTTVMHSCQQVSRRMSTEKDFRKDVEAFEATLKK